MVSSEGRAGTGGRAKRELVWKQLLPTAADDERLPGAKLVPVAAIDPNPDQPRRGVLDGIEDLAASIAEYGLLQPIVVTPPYSGRYTCVAGHRRLAAYKHLSARPGASSRWATIPALVRDTDSADRLVLAMVENLSRQALSDAETITGLRLLHDLRGWPQAEIARRLGVSKAWINHYFRVARDAEATELVQTERLSVAKAYPIALARSPETHEAAIAAALRGAPLRTIRKVAQGASSDCTPDSAGPGPADSAADSAPAGGGAAYSDCTPDATDERAPGSSAGPAEPIATAAPPPGARDLSEVARELGLTIPLVDLASTPLFAVALRDGLPYGDVEALMKAMREDLRRLEGLVRTAQLERRADARP